MEVSREEIVDKLIEGSIPLYKLEKLFSPAEAVEIRREYYERTTSCSIEGVPHTGYDYNAILGQNCENVIGYVPIPLGLAGPLLINDEKVPLPMATTEGCLVAGCSRGCKAINASGGCISTIFRDGMTRAPCLTLNSAADAVELALYIENEGLTGLMIAFNSTTSFGRLESIKCFHSGRNLYVRFCAFTGDAMGMNMISKGVKACLEHLANECGDKYPFKVVAISGNVCTDKKATAVNWLDGRGKSVICETVIEKDVLSKVLKVSVDTIVDLNTRKNLVGSAVAGALGGFNAHAANLVAASFLALGQDCAQVVESSNCITNMEKTENGDLYMSVTLPSLEVGTIGGGTHLPAQQNLLTLIGCVIDRENPGFASKRLAKVIAGTVLAGELNLCAALAARELVSSHMRLNRKREKPGTCEK
ncbi:hypothetical protein PCE1_002819 [Barthelona sp. PCE]